MDNMIDIDIDASFTLTEVDEEEFMDYYIRIDKILQLEREFHNIEDTVRRDYQQLELKVKEDEKELEYYAKVCEEDEPAYIWGYWR